MTNGEPLFSRNLTCVIPTGSLVAITGPSGVGKSTLLKLLARELEPDQGNIALGETPLARIQAEELYQHLVLVSQDSHIFNTSLRENLLMAKPDATEQDMRGVLEAVCLTNLVEKLVDGLDTRLGEHGEMLSGGERRRLSLAQALLKAPSILLLDEPTTGVDRDTAQRILTTLRAWLPLSTIVVATHEAWLGSRQTITLSYRYVVDTPGVFVLYSDDESFTFMTPTGHLFASWITFSAYEEDDCTVIQIHMLLRPNDPLYEMGMRLRVIPFFEDRF